MAKDPAFPFYANDWLSSTQIACMSAEEERGYLRLLCHAWNDPDCSLPDDDEVLARLSLMGENWTKGSSCLVRGCFTKHPTKQGRIINEKLFAIRQERNAWREKCRQGGVKSGATRRSSTKGSSTTVRSKRELNGNSSSSSSKNSLPNGKELPPKSPKGDSVSVGKYTQAFIRFWSAVPPHKSKGKQAAAKAYTRHAAGLKARFTDPDAWLFERAAAYYSSDVGKTQYALSPAPWLNQGGYDDDPESWRRKESSERTNQPRAQAHDPNRPIGDL